jgi:hypothetical protein
MPVRLRSRLSTRNGEMDTSNLPVMPTGKIVYNEISHRSAEMRPNRNDH